MVWRHFWLVILRSSRRIRQNNSILGILSSQSETYAFCVKIIMSKFELIWPELDLTCFKGQAGWQLTVKITITIYIYAYDDPENLCHTACLRLSPFIELLWLDLNNFKHGLCTHAVALLDITSTLGEIELFATRLTDLTVKMLYFDL